jgi:hypothetical protein
MLNTLTSDRMKKHFKMKRFIIVLLLYLPIVSLSGQDTLCNCTVDQRSLFETVLTGRDFQMKRTSGNQLFRDGSFRGDIVLASGDTVKDKLISYNGYEDELIWTMSGNMNLIKVDKEQVDKFVLHTDDGNPPVTFKHLQGTIAGNRQINFYAQILFEDKISLYATHNFYIVEKVERETGGKINYIDRIEPSPTICYIGLKDNKYLVIRYFRKNSLYSLFPDYQEEIRALMNRHHQPLRNVNDLVAIIRLLNENNIIK